ncbi:MAG TPA: zf-HC2 domain-containing protein [Candidatus Acidoferrales bacterium]|nr:zf-HC2 domain-containing protein [Candidatus Acidoferrales bacterium]
MRPHDDFLELCAISTTGELSPEEQQQLKEHLVVCAECRRALQEFEAAVDEGVPLLSSLLSEIPSEKLEAAPENHAAPALPVREGVSDLAQDRASLLAMESRAETPPAHREAGHRTRLNWNFVWVPFAAGILLTVALGIYAYRIGRSRGLEVARVTTSSAADQRTAALEQQISDAGHERELLAAQLAGRDRMISDLRHEIERQSAALSETKTVQANLERSIETNQSGKQQVVAQNASLTQKLNAVQASLEKTESQLNAVQQQRSEGQVRVAGLQSQIDDLSTQLREREAAIDRQEGLLSHDRDIRELMGARELYIAEVYDVGRDGATKKPFGRVFYTQGKSLVFYAYDLDQQQGIKKAATFQAWGRRGPEEDQALNLGIFYQDNVAKKRWVLKFANPKELGQIDAVFVTVEPKGGSDKPSGKPLLFAYLKASPNHP